MCGIAGILYGHDIRTVEKMITTLRHRGPDGHGLWHDAHCVLGHTRLSIIDLEGGAQPMSDPEGRSHIVFNGEIYNYRDLRAQIGEDRFCTQSDTEVILHLYREDPIRHVERLDGMFAYAIVKDGEITLARDPLGIKPLYIGWHNGSLAFASEIKALLKTCDTVKEFPPGYVYSSRTGLKRHYHLNPRSPNVSDIEAAKRGITERLQEAVRKRLIADVPVGVFLSGGLDSSLIAAFARRHKDPLDSFSVGTEDSPDRECAWHVAEFLGTRHHEYIYTIEKAIEALPEVIYYLESFDCSLVRSAIPNFFLAKLASHDVKVALSGEGSDELFAGYDYLKGIAPDVLQDELLYITCALHNTNLQRCDRMSMAHGLEVRVPFLDVKLVDYAFRIPVGLKLPAQSKTEKWILRKVAEEVLPEEIVWRRKSKFAVGAGLGDKLAQFAEEQIGDAEFAHEREIGDGLFLRSKEELLYYRIFSEQYPVDKFLPLIGRSRSV
ncbi:MAG: asparagine synthase B [Candidatus Latescibacteria bacterium]|nr:asparagine synthase B [Candidatus Latescibacterota bacterium]